MASWAWVNRSWPQWDDVNPGWARSDQRAGEKKTPETQIEKLGAWRCLTGCSQEVLSWKDSTSASQLCNICSSGPVLPSQNALPYSASNDRRQWTIWILPRWCSVSFRRGDSLFKTLTFLLRWQVKHRESVVTAHSTETHLLISTDLHTCCLLQWLRCRCPKVSAWATWVGAFWDRISGGCKARRAQEGEPGGSSPVIRQLD